MSGVFFYNKILIKLLFSLLQVLESVWLVLKGNVNLAFSFVTAVLSLLFGGGTALLNFIISAVSNTFLFPLLLLTSLVFRLTFLLPSSSYTSFLALTLPSSPFLVISKEKANNIIKCNKKKCPNNLNSVRKSACEVNSIFLLLVSVN